MRRLAFCAAVLASFASAPASADAFQPALVDGVPTQAVRGVWRVPGYGFVFDFRTASPALYVEAGDLCWQAEFDAEGAADYAARAQIEPGKAVFTGAPGGTLYRFDRIDDVPASCRRSPPAVFDAFWAAMEARYAFFDVRGIDWQQRRRPEAALTEALTGFHDPHLTLQTGSGRFSEAGPTKRALLDAAKKAELPPSRFYQAWRESDHQHIADALLGRSARRGAAGQIRWGRIGARLGYVAIDAMTGLGGDDVVEDTQRAGTVLDRVLRDLGDTDAMIVDVAANRGGEDRVSAAIAGRFADARRLAYTKRPYGVADVVPQRFHVEPLGARQYTKPVFLLTSDLTVSAGETFVLRMRQLPHVTQVGGTTAGAFSDMLPTPLPNGWLLTISNEIVATPSGEVPEGKGLVPQQRFDVFPDIAAGHLDALRALVAWIER